MPFNLYYASTSDIRIIYYVPKCQNSSNMAIIAEFIETEAKSEKKLSVVFDVIVNVSEEI